MGIEKSCLEIKRKLVYVYGRSDFFVQWIFFPIKVKESWNTIDAGTS